MGIVRVSDKQIQDSYDGFELYFDHQDKILYSSPKCLARWVECHPETIKRIAGTLNLGKQAETQTQQGLRMGTLFTSAEVITILNALIDGKRTKASTKIKAKERLTLLATLGNELGGMLVVAPEELAKIAINATTTEEQLNEIDNHASQHKKYLQTHHGLHNTLHLRGAEAKHHATVNKHNNELVGVPQGKRPVMTERQKDEMTFLQLAEKMKLDATKTNTAWQAVNVCKDAGYKAKTALKQLMGE